MKLSELANLLNLKQFGANQDLLGVCSLDTPKAGHILAVSNISQLDLLLKKKSELQNLTCFLIAENLEKDFIEKITPIHHKEKYSYLLAKNFKIDFINLLKNFNPYAAPVELSLLDQEIADKHQAKIGPNCVAGKNLKMGKNCRLVSGVYLGDHVELGDQVTLYPNVVIHSGTIIKSNTIVHSGVVIGDDGFGYEPTAEGNRKIPQIGKVIIGEQVEIGANCCIDRGTIDATVIGDRVKIDNLVQIAHNVMIGDDSILVSQVGIAGSSTVGSRVVLAGQVGVSDHVRIGNDVQVGAQSGIMPGKMIPANSTIFGSPALPYRQKLKMEIALQKLSEKK